MNRYLLSFLLILPISFYIVAQENNEEIAESEVEEVVVSGIRSSLVDAIEIKRENVGVVDAITAEDIGKFADRNIAEALSRLVGVTTNRDNGESTSVTVRGLGPEFNLVTLNGRSMPTVPPLWVGGRSFDFGDISSSGVAAVEVYKSANAILPSGGLGSTINMVTTKPLNAKDGDGGISVRVMNHSKVETGDDYTPEVDFVYIRNGEFNGGRWGASVSGSHHEMDNRETGTNEITWIPSATINNVPGNAVVTSSNARADNAFFYPNALKYKAMDNERVRKNLQTTLQYEMGNVVATLDYTLSSVSTDQYGVQAGTYLAGWDTTSMTVNQNGAVVAGFVNGTYFDGGIFQNDFMWAEGKTNNKSLGINFDIQLTDNFNLVLDYHDSSAGFKGNPGGSATSSATFGNGCWAAWDWYPVNVASACFRDRSFDFSNKVGSLSWGVDKNFQGANTGATEFDESDIGPREAYINYQDRSSELDQLQIIGSWDNVEGMFTESLVSIDFGYSEQETSFHSQKWFNYVRTGHVADGNPVNMTYAFLPDEVLNKVTKNNFLGSGNPFYYFTMTQEDMFYWFGRAGFIGDLNTGDGTWWNAYGPGSDWPAACYRNDAYNEFASNYPNGLVATSIYDAPTSNWGELDGCYGDRDSNSFIKETIETLFVNFNFETVTEKGQLVRAQLGLRYEEEDRASTSDTLAPTNTVWSLGAFAYGDKVGLITAPTSYTGYGSSDYLLPSFNMSFEYAENKVVKVALSKTISRPALEQMDTAVTSSVFSYLYPTTLSTGNPDLEPYESTNIDLAYEYYYKEGSYAAINYFRKEIDGYHGAGFVQGPFNGVTDITQGPRAALAVPTNDDALCQWTASQGYWACGWSNAYDWAWLVNTGYTFGCNGQSDCFADPGNGNAVFQSNSGDPLYIFNLAQPINQYDGTLDGWEFAVQHLFDNDWGVVANVTLVGGDTNADPYPIEAPEQFALPGFGDAANFAVFYENEKISARVAYNLTGEYFTGYDQYNPLWVTEREQVDFNATYNVNDSTAVFVEGINVTDEDVLLYSRYEEMTFLYQDHGPIYKVGFRVKF